MALTNVHAPIVVAVDGSPESQAALEWAVEEGQTHRASAAHRHCVRRADAHLGQRRRVLQPHDRRPCRRRASRSASWSTTLRPVCCTTTSSLAARSSTSSSAMPTTPHMIVLGTRPVRRFWERLRPSATNRINRARLDSRDLRSSQRPSHDPRGTARLTVRRSNLSRQPPSRPGSRSRTRATSDGRHRRARSTPLDSHSLRRRRRGARTPRSSPIRSCPGSCARPAPERRARSSPASRWSATPTSIQVRSVWMTPPNSSSAVSPQRRPVTVGGDFHPGIDALVDHEGLGRLVAHAELHAQGAVVGVADGTRELGRRSAPAPRRGTLRPSRNGEDANEQSHGLIVRPCRLRRTGTMVPMMRRLPISSVPNYLRVDACRARHVGRWATGVRDRPSRSDRRR